MPAASQSVVVTAIREIDRKLRKLPGAVQKKVVRQAMHAGLKVMKASAQAEALVDKGVLKRNVVVRAVRRRKRGSIELEVRVNPNDQTKKTSAKTGKTTFYPAVVQFGRLKDGIEADPFMTREFDADGERARDVTMQALRAGVEREVAGS